MGNLDGAYNPDAQLPSDRDPIPAGTYRIELTESEVAATKAGTGQLLKFTARVIEGDYEGRLVWGQINLQNQNPTAQEIGQSEFAALRLVSGTPNPQDTSDLHFKAFDAVTEIEPAKGDYKAKNQINWRKTAKLVDGETPQPETKATPTATKTEPTKTTAAPAKRPWNTKKAA